MNRNPTPKHSRRAFIKTGARALAGAVLPSSLSARRRGAASARLVISVMGVNGRGLALAEEFARHPDCHVAYICDVDSRAAARCAEAVQALADRRPRMLKDFRHSLDDKDVDALVIAAPDHWHAPASLLALQAGKHVYVEKPCGHNPREGELLVEGQRKYRRIVQMGNQQRSSPHTREALRIVREGIIGRLYMGKAFYANTRGPIGHGRPAPVPDWLDWDLWQGPAPRTEYRDNIVHYNWHWFWRWGTGESCNNAAHEVDVCRWFLDAGFPTKVTSIGGRYHYDDDWEFYDTQTIGWEFEGRKAIQWEGRSCNGRPVEGRARGSVLYGEGGTLILDRNGYELYDNDNTPLRKQSADETVDALDTTGAGGSLNALHIANFCDAVRSRAEPNAPIDEGHVSVLLCHLGNIAQKMGRSLTIDPRSGRILNDAGAMKMWGRDYEPGWAPKV
jgi:predicted dehydrogenase